MVVVRDRAKVRSVSVGRKEYARRKLECGGEERAERRESL